MNRKYDRCINIKEFIQELQKYPEDTNLCFVNYDKNGSSVECIFGVELKDVSTSDVYGMIEEASKYRLECKKLVFRINASIDATAEEKTRAKHLEQQILKLKEELRQIPV